MSAATGNAAPLLDVQGLKKHFPIYKGVFSRVRGHVYAVDGVSFRIGRGETLGLVGESGCGKSTVGRTVLKLLEPTEGRIRLDGEDITELGAADMMPYRQRMQMIFQDPYASLNPRMPASSIVGEPMTIHGVSEGAEREERVEALFERVGLGRRHLDSYPHEFSGGQRQRIGIARALALNPDLIVGDEPVSALDVSIQAQIINLLMDLQDELKLSYLFVAHDLAVVEHISHRVAVMYLGRIVEITDKTSLFDSPLHPPTRRRCSLRCRCRRRAPAAASASFWRATCRARSTRPQAAISTRAAPMRWRAAAATVPALREVQAGHWAACHLHDGEGATAGLPGAATA